MFSLISNDLSLVHLGFVCVFGSQHLASSSTAVVRGFYQKQIHRIDNSSENMLCANVGVYFLPQ